MIRRRAASELEKEAGAVTSTNARQAVPRPYVRVEVAESDRPRLWQVISDNEWSGEYLGKNIFVFSQEQLAVLSKAGIPLRSID